MYSGSCYVAHWWRGSQAPYDKENENLWQQIRFSGFLEMSGLIDCCKQWQNKLFIEYDGFYNEKKSMSIITIKVVGNNRL